MDFKEKLYSSYITTHNRHLQGDVNLNSIRSTFSALDYFYGKMLPENKEAVILDIGCGNGNFVFFLKESGYLNSHGIDISEEQIASGRAIGIADIELTDILEFLVSKNNLYDCIIARDVIEHFTRQEAFETMELVCNALKPGGSFLMQVPNGQGLFHTSIFYGDYTHETPYTFQSVRQLFLNTGFSKVECFPVNPYPGTWKGLIRSLLWKIKVLQTQFWKMVETGSPSGIFTSNLIAKGTK